MRAARTWSRMARCCASPGGPSLAGTAGAAASARMMRQSGAGSSSAMTGSTRSMASCVASRLDAITEELPLKDAFLFSKHSNKWTREELRTHSRALASGLVEVGCKPGDAIAVWLPDYAEKVACQLAAATAGLVISCVDPSLDTVEAFEKVLYESGAKIVIVEEKHCAKLKEAIPEMEYFSQMQDLSGKPFRSRKFPNLRYLVHTGYDRVPGVFDFYNVLLYDPPTCPLLAIEASVKDDAPLGVTYTNKGGKATKGPTLTHKDILAGKGGAEWSAVVDALSKKYVTLG